METWYGSKHYRNEIEEIEVIKSTAKQLVTEYEGWEGKKKQRRIAKSSWGAEYFLSLKEAVAHKRHILQAYVQRAKESVERTSIELDKFNQQYPEKD
ncbi:unnamed protein product [marine sediment metagenome]|uniref:Uncharacterized protein n=1 Tax=marine sediment metagenome TaxID=412755 RepID=X1L2F1_9ZZZZ